MDRNRGGGWRGGGVGNSGRVGCVVECREVGCIVGVVWCRVVVGWVKVVRWAGVEG